MNPWSQTRYKKTVIDEINSDWGRDFTIPKSYNDSLKERNDESLQDSYGIYLTPKIDTIERIVKVRHSYDSVLISINDYSHLININDLLDEEDKLLLNPKILEKANQLINKIHQIATNNNCWWDEPLVNVTEYQEIVLEWWNKKKKITIYVDSETIDYIKVWGADMDSEMEDGTIDLDDNLTSFWNWINE